ncbi:MAG TPA: peptide MFS transporter [Polyangia bacterium]|jgi:POT family proton-dependent oligopeptide transporter|nr:peptide MFS transporter [Polyangia bacterium]
MDEAAAVAPPLKQPKGLYLLFNVEMWERFSFYGMRAFLILFLISNAGGFGWSKEDAHKLYSWYAALVYLTPLLGGFLADRVLGTHKAILIGSVLITSGHFCLAFPSTPTFFGGLALIILGTGFHKSNISTMVGQLYQPGDGRRDAGFTIFYMGINAGAFLGQIVCGFLAKDPRFGWHWGFGAAGVGMAIGTTVYVIRKRKVLGTIGDAPAARARVTNSDAVAQPPVALTSVEKRRILAIVILAVFNIFFWSAFEQAATSMNLFAEERTNRTFFGWLMPAPWFQTTNALTIMLFAPAFARLWTLLAARGREPSTPAKFIWSLLLVAAGFAVMVFGALGSEGGARVSALWLVAAYVLHTWGELCLSPVGLSMVTKLAPARLGSVMMGLWFGSFSVSEWVGARIAGQIEKIEKGQLFHLLGGQADFFLIFVIVPLIGAALLWALSGTIVRLTGPAAADNRP